jgi:hypothetical protein
MKNNFNIESRGELHNVIKHITRLADSPYTKYPFSLIIKSSKNKTVQQLQKYYSLIDDIVNWSKEQGDNGRCDKEYWDLVFRQMAGLTIKKQVKLLTGEIITQYFPQSIAIKSEVGSKQIASLIENVIEFCRDRGIKIKEENNDN